MQQLATTINDANTAIEKDGEADARGCRSAQQTLQRNYSSERLVIRETLSLSILLVITPDSVRNLNDQIRAINAAISGAGTLPADKRVIGPSMGELQRQYQQLLEQYADCALDKAMRFAGTKNKLKIPDVLRKRWRRIYLRQHLLLGAMNG